MHPPPRSSGYDNRPCQPPEGVDAEALPRRQLARHLDGEGLGLVDVAGTLPPAGVADGHRLVVVVGGRAVTPVPLVDEHRVALDEREHGVADDDRIDSYADLAQGVVAGDVACVGCALDVGGHGPVAAARCQRADDEAEEQGYRDCDSDLGQRFDVDVVSLSHISDVNKKIPEYINFCVRKFVLYEDSY